MRRIEDRDTCRYLRTKGMYVEAEPDPQVPDTGSGLCWCVHTQNQLGPDGGVVELDRCTPGRSCYHRP